MNIKTIPSNHKVFRTDDGLAMIAFESGPFPNPKMIPRIHLYSRSRFKWPNLNDGKVFGHGAGSSYVLLVKAPPLSIVHVVEWSPGKGRMEETFYHIGPCFEVTPIPLNSNRFSITHIQYLLQSSPPADPENLLLMESDTKLLFGGGQPTWLQKVIDARLAYWRIHNLDLYFQHTHWRLSNQDIWDCVRGAPYWALARWKNLLKSYQVDICVRNSPLGALSFAPERLSLYLRNRYLDKYLVDAVTHASDKFTKDCLLGSATCEPDAKLSSTCRRHLSPQLRASLLAIGYRKFRTARFARPKRDLQLEFLDSIIEFPAVWLAAHHDDFAEVMEGLATHLSIRPEGMALLDMIERMQPPHQKAFATYVGSFI